MPVDALSFRIPPFFPRAPLHASEQVTAGRPGLRGAEKESPHTTHSDQRIAVAVTALGHTDHYQSSLNLLFSLECLRGICWEYTEKVCNLRALKRA